MAQDHATALRAFRLIARHGSFTRAAAELEVTPLRSARRCGSWKTMWACACCTGPRAAWG